MDKLYTASVTATGGRNGKVVSDDGILNLDVKMPKALGGAGGEATNPEQLFAAGYAACFDSALQLVIRTKRVKVESTEVTAHVSIGKDTDGGFYYLLYLMYMWLAFHIAKHKNLWKRLTVYVLTRKQHEEILKLH